MHRSPRTPWSRVCLLLLVPILLAAGCARSPANAPVLRPTATALPGATSPGELTFAAPLTLDRATVARGETIVGGVTYANATGRPITIRNLIIALRGPAAAGPDSEDLHFSPTSGAATIAPGERIALVATFTPPTTAPTGQWRAFSSYQDLDGRWHDAPPAHVNGFTVGARPIAAPTTPPSAIPPSATQPSAVATSPDAPPLDVATPLYWGAYIDGVPWDPARLASFEAQAGKGVSIVHWGQAWWHDGAYQPFYASDFEGVRAHGAIPLLDWASWDYCCGPDQPQFSLASIIRGDHDPYIREWATGARDWGHPLFLRFNWEMNGWWRFPWSERLNGNQPGEFVRAWRHVHDLFASAGATNVTWVWCPNVINSGTTPLASLYPGDDYVDWVGMDGYNWGDEYDNDWQTFAEIFAPTYAALRQLAPDKPIMLPEIASVEQGGDKAAWIRNALGPELPARFPAIKAVVWFEWDDGVPALTWSIRSSAATAVAFRDVVGGSPVYLPNHFGDLVAAPIPPPAPATPAAANR